MGPRLDRSAGTGVVESLAGLRASLASAQKLTKVSPAESGSTGEKWV